MYVGTGSGIELFTHNDVTNPTSHLSVVGVPTDWAPLWNTNTLSNSLGTQATPLLDEKNGNKQDFAIHGLMYAPNQAVRLYATNADVSTALGGIVASKLELQSSSSTVGPIVSVPTQTPFPRQVLITAIAQGLVSGEKSLTSSAVIQIGTAPATTVTVQSWRTSGPTDP
jgi:hypothetical protein